MSTRMSSAGLLYVYLSAYPENGKLCLRQLDSYRCIGDELYYRIMDMAAHADEVERSVHIFAVVGPKDKTDAVISIFEDELKANFQRVLANKRIKTSTQKLDSLGNDFFRCVQEFYCAQGDHFPKSVSFNYGDVVVEGICCDHSFGGEVNPVIDAAISLWVERERPMLCGRQVMTRSFFMRDFTDRKMIASLPDGESGLWRLVFEGGSQLYLSEDMPYTKRTLHPDDIGFCTSNAQAILLNPIYAYGKSLQPNDICEEWHKVFLYLCAISDAEWDRSDIQRVYEKFLKFLEENICLPAKAEPYISKEQYCSALLKHITDFRRFLRGEDEPVISKDLLQTLNSRYVYLPYLWPLIKPTSYSGTFSSSELNKMVDQALCESEAYRKGVLWEDTTAYVLRNVEGWIITGRRIKAGAQEVDMSIANASLDPALWQLGAYILVECKNWKARVDIHQIRNIAHISKMKGNKTAILFAANGITSDAREEIQRLAADDLSIICITAEDLRYLNSGDDCRRLVLERWEELRDGVELSAVI